MVLLGAVVVEYGSLSSYMEPLPMPTTLAVPSSELSLDERIAQMVWTDFDGKEYRKGDMWFNPVTNQEVEVFGAHWPPHSFFDTPENLQGIVIEGMDSEGNFDLQGVLDQMDCAREMLAVSLGQKTIDQAIADLEAKWGLTPMAQNPPTPKKTRKTSNPLPTSSKKRKTKQTVDA